MVMGRQPFDVHWPKRVIIKEEQEFKALGAVAFLSRRPERKAAYAAFPK
jgi:hypothetical protein